jgi:hypothetical protein
MHNGEFVQLCFILCSETTTNPLKETLMKSMIAFLAMAFFTTTFAQAAGPNILLESYSRGGMPGPDGSYFSKTQITEDGVIQKMSGLINKPAKAVVYARLSAAALQSLKSQIAQQEISALPKPEDGPLCADAPMTTVSIYKADGTKADIAESVSCRQAVMDKAYGLMNIVRGVDALTSGFPLR